MLNCSKPSGTGCEGGFSTVCCLLPFGQFLQPAILRFDQGDTDLPPFKVALVGAEGQPVPEWVRTNLSQKKIDLLVHECASSEELAQYAGDADVVWVWGSRVVTADRLDVLRRCGAILRSGSGTDNVPVNEATSLGILVANTPEATSFEVSDHAVGLLLAVIRQISVQDRAVRQGKWSRDLGFPRWHLRGQTLAVIGFGHIGKLFVHKMRAFDLTILVCDPVVDAALMAQHGVQRVSLDEALSRADFVSLHCPLTKATHHLIGERELRMMKPTSVLINTSRGGLIDEAMLVRALKEGWISAAGLDVLEQQPPVPDNPLLSLDNVVITPHIAGYSDIFLEHFWRHSVETVIDLAEGHWPRSCVNPEVVPRWNLSRDLAKHNHGSAL